MASLDATPSIDCYRLIVLFFEATPDINQIEALVDTLPEPSAVHFAQCDAHSERASMWTRNPTGRLPSGRLALEYPSNELDLSLSLLP